MHITHPIIKPVRNHDPDADKERLAADVLPPFARLAQLRLVQGDGGGFDAGSEASYEA